jgi:phosphate transport system permease protein
MATEAPSTTTQNTTRYAPLTTSSARLKRRKIVSSIFAGTCFLITMMALMLLVWLLWGIFQQGWSHLSMSFLTSFPSRFAGRAGIKSALYGSIWVLCFCMLFVVPIGVGAAIFLQEYSERNRFARFAQVNIANLAGVPSIVYGILGLALFVRFFRLERSVLAGGLTLALLVMPIVIIAAQEALRGVPSSLRDGSYALGATRWQTIRRQVLPIAMPGILTGVILAVSRAIGETAPLIMLGALTYVAFVPRSPLDGFTTLPIQVFNWTSRPQPEFQEIAASGIIVLLAVLLFLNATAILLRYRFNRRV